MTKSEIEHHVMKDKLQDLSCVIEVSLHRKEIELKLEAKNPEWGMPNKLEELLKNEDIAGGKWAIVDFSHMVTDLDKYNNCRITLYIRPF